MLAYAVIILIHTKSKPELWTNIVLKINQTKQNFYVSYTTVLGVKPNESVDRTTNLCTVCAIVDPDVIYPKNYSLPDVVETPV